MPRPLVWSPAFFFLAVAAHEIKDYPPETALWATPAILFAAMMIAWAAEAAQFFVAQGFALAILAWLQTLPEFAVEAVYAWRQQVPLLMANLTGALRLLTGLGWPMIYFTAALFYRRKYKRPLNSIRLADEHCVEVVGLLVPLVYFGYVCVKRSLDLIDAVVLILMYIAYLLILSRMPAEQAESVEDLDRIPRSIVRSSRTARNASIAGLFLLGGGVIYFAAEPFAGSLQSVAMQLGIPVFVFVQWVAPFVSEFPEKVSAFYWARTIDRAPMALMNMVSSNINQWTLLAAMLPVVFSMSRGTVSSIPLDDRQTLELVMTVGQSLVGMIFLVNMELFWWEALVLFALWFIQFVFSPMEDVAGWVGWTARRMHLWVTVAYFLWSGGELLRMILGRRNPDAFRLFGIMWNKHVRRNA